LLLVSLALLCAGLLSAGAMPASAGGPPSGLTPNGQVIWNLDALLNDTFGSRVDCWDGEQERLFSVPHGSYCPSPEARYQEYVFTFLNAFHSDFRLVRLAAEPNTGATSAAIRVGGDFVSCPDGEYHHGGRGWLVVGGAAGPKFWCN
jgi:hypothetical protein